MPKETNHVVVAGAGGNTGSHLLPHLARMSWISRLTLVDPEFYRPPTWRFRTSIFSTLAGPRLRRRRKS